MSSLDEERVRREKHRQRKAGMEHFSALSVQRDTKQWKGAVSMKRVLLVLLTLALMTGRTGGGTAVKPIRANEAEKVTMAPVERTAELEEAYADFAVELLRAGRAEGKNTLMSPLSVTLALGMTAMGAEGDTAAEFEQVFGMDKETLGSYCRALMKDYAELGGSSETNLVNSLWCDPDLTLNDSFVNTCAENFAAELFHADLQNADTVKEVNKWVKEATRGMIPKVVDRFDDQAVLALINAVYFKNQFLHPFKTPTWEWTIDFQNADGTVSQPQGMSNGERSEIYLSHENGQGVVMPYDDGKLGLLLMLPDEGVSLTDYLSGWDGQTVSGLLNAQTERRVDLRVPKFKAEWSGELSDELIALGLANAFDAGKADFTAMGSSENGPLYIGGVIHKTAFEVNEKGTEAAAVTAVIMEATAAMPQDDLIVLRFDRPFVYGIVDLQTGAPLFLGTMEQMD